MGAASTEGGCCGAARSSAQAVQNGYTYTYVYTGATLEKRRGCGMVVKSVTVDCRQQCQGQVAQAPRMDVEGGYGMAAATASGCCCAGCGCAEAGQSASACCAGEGAQAGCGGSAGDGAGMACGTHGPKLAADAEAVTLRCCGQLLAWDLDLNPGSVQDLGEGCCRF